MEKAAVRLRRDGWCTQRVAVSISGFDKHSAQKRNLMATQDTLILLQTFEQLWRDLNIPTRPVSISVHLGDVVLLKDRSGELFLPLEPGRQNRQERLSKALDHINRRFPPKTDGKRIITVGPNLPHPGFFERR